MGDNIEKVYLRPLSVVDASTSWRWRNDSQIWMYTASRPDRIVSEKMEREWAEMVIADPSRINFAICLAPSNRYIGNIYLVNIKDGKGELGVFIGDKSCQGKGYARQALELLKSKARKELGICEIVVSVSRDNIPALVTYLKSGARIFDDRQWLNLSIRLP